VKVLTSELRQLVEKLEGDPTLMEPQQMTARLAALHRLDACLPLLPAADENASELHGRARTLSDRLETANLAVHEAIRAEIRSGARPDMLLHWAHALMDRNSARPSGVHHYDSLDELVTGVLGFDEPEDSGIRPEPEKVLYQPTPARLIFNLLEETRLTANDVLVDLGSGMGHVPLLAAICTPAHCIGIEVEQAYIDRARQCAQRLHLRRAHFIRQDARDADCKAGTVFYLYTPFSGSILRRVLDRLRHEASTRTFRVCTYGPCAETVAREPWLKAEQEPQAQRITVFATRAASSTRQSSA